MAVVDLARLRAAGAGDALRVLFEQQGANDDFTLAPLDQTLPSFAQHQFGVQALPQEWAWCQAWCGKAGKAQVRRAARSGKAAPACCGLWRGLVALQACAPRSPRRASAA